MINSLLYQRQTIRLPRHYPDFAAYKNDPDNLSESEIPRIERLMKAAPIPQSFASREQASDFLLHEVMFPGYGFSILQLNKPLALYSLEIPRKNEDRWVTFAPRDSSWMLVDDFIWPLSQGGIASAEQDGYRIRYRDRSGKVLREKLLTPPGSEPLH